MKPRSVDWKKRDLPVHYNELRALVRLPSERMMAETGYQGEMRQKVADDGVIVGNKNRRF